MKTSSQNILRASQGRLLQILAFSTLIFGISAVQAQTTPAPTPVPNANSTTPTDSSSDKLDLGNLEQKYWSAKDDDFTVVQNRTYTKNKKWFVSLMAGRLINDGFLEGGPSGASFGYFFNEKNGIALDYRTFSSHDNSVTKEFFTYGTKPAYNSPLSTTSLSYMWSPIYAKVSLLEKKILYLDMSIGVHAGVSKYKIMTDYGGTVKQTTHYGIDISQLWFLNKYLALRFDIRNTWSTQSQLKYAIANNLPASARELGTTRLQDNTWLLGINFFFGK